MKKKLSFIIAFIVLVFIISIFLIPGIDRNANIPKYKQKLWGSAFNIFMVLPDPIKSTLMIFSGKRSFSNLFNDYNVKFLPETQYIKINFKRKVLKYKKKNRNTFFLETYKNSIFVVTKYGEILRINLDQLKNKSKNLPYKKIETINLINIPGYILDTLIIEDKIYISKVSKYKNCKKLEIFSADILDEILNLQLCELESLLKKQQLHIKLTQNLRDHILLEGYDPVYGARPLKRAIKNLLENPLAKKILEGKLKKDSLLTLDWKDDQVIIV